MKNIIYFIVLGLISSFLLTSCDKENLVTPSVESPVLVMVSGTSFLPTANVTVTASFFELDKTHILDHSKGIDTIAVSNLQIRVYRSNNNEVASMTTDNDGKVTLVRSWADLGLNDPVKDNAIRLEFSGSHKGVNFRQMHTVTVQ